MKCQKIYGIHAVFSLLQTRPESIEKLYVQDGRNDRRLDEIRTIAASENIRLKVLPRCDLEALLDEDEGVSHQGVLAEVGAAPTYSEADLPQFLAIKNVLLLILDGVQDPHNLGACLRSANAMGVHAVIAPKDRAVGITPTVRKVACGAAEITPFIQVSNLARALKLIKKEGVWLVGGIAEADTLISEVDLTGPIALVMGSEGKGLRRLTREHCDFLAAIPMAGSVSSLNVSVATGIGLYEMIRQRSEKSASAAT